MNEGQKKTEEKKLSTIRSMKSGDVCTSEVAPTWGVYLGGKRKEPSHRANLIHKQKMHPRIPRRKKASESQIETLEIRQPADPSR